jgi:hypothetical protein
MRPGPLTPVQRPAFVPDRARDEFPHVQPPAAELECAPPIQELAQVRIGCDVQQTETACMSIPCGFLEDAQPTRNVTLPQPQQPAQIAFRGVDGQISYEEIHGHLA